MKPIQRILLQQIDISDQTFSVNFMPDFERLRSSVKAAGFIQPVLLREKPQGYQIVSGFRRISVARELGYDAIEARIFGEKEMEDLKLFLISLQENLTTRGLNAIEKAIALEKLIDYFKDKLPILGVCLGHQAIVQYFGGKIGHAPEPMHGKPSRIMHNEKGIFAGIENPMQAGRYHSLCALSLPDCLEQTAEFEGIVMGVKHKKLPVFGVQFHPESILTPAGGKIIENVLSIAIKREPK